LTNIEASLAQAAVFSVAVAALFPSEVLSSVVEKPSVAVRIEADHSICDQPERLRLGAVVVRESRTVG